MSREKIHAWARAVAECGGTNREEDARERMLRSVPDGIDFPLIAAAAIGVIGGCAMVQMDADVDLATAAIRAVIAENDVNGSKLFATVCENVSDNREQTAGLMVAMRDRAIEFSEQNKGVNCATICIAGICVAVNSLLACGLSREQAAGFIQSWLALADTFESSAKILGTENGKN